MKPAITGWFALVFALALSALFAPSPARAIDPYTALSVGSALLPKSEYLFTPVGGSASAHWYVRDYSRQDRLRGFWRESSGQASFLPNFGRAVIPVHFPNSWGKGIKQAFVTENATLDLRQDKPGDKRPRRREEEYDRFRHFPGCQCSQCLASSISYEEMENCGGLWFFRLELNKLAPGTHTFKVGPSVEGLKEVTRRFLIGKKAEYKDGLREVTVEVNIINFRGPNGEPVDPAFLDENGPDGLNYQLITAACPGLQLVDAVLRIPRPAPPQQPFVFGGNPQGFGQPMTLGVPPQNVRKTAEERVVATPDGTTRTSGPPASQPAPNGSGSNRWVAMRNQWNTATTFSVKLPTCAALKACKLGSMEWLDGGVTKPCTVQPGKEFEFELPAGVSGGIQVFVLEDGTWEPYKNTKESNFEFPLPEVGGGIRIRFETPAPVKTGA
jgi:hypothetical protein